MKLEYPEELKKLFVEWGRQGGKKVLKKHGVKHFSKLAKKRNKKRMQAEKEKTRQNLAI